MMNGKIGPIGEVLETPKKPRQSKEPKSSAKKRKIKEVEEEDLDEADPANEDAEESAWTAKMMILRSSKSRTGGLWIRQSWSTHVQVWYHGWNRNYKQDALLTRWSQGFELMSFTRSSRLRKNYVLHHVVYMMTNNEESWSAPFCLLSQ